MQEIEVRKVHEGDAQAFLDLLPRIDSETEFMLLEAGERLTTVEEQRERINEYYMAKIVDHVDVAGKQSMQPTAQRT